MKTKCKHLYLEPEGDGFYIYRCELEPDQVLGEENLQVPHEIPPRCRKDRQCENDKG